MKQYVQRARARIPFTRISEISSLVGSSNWPCISIKLEANWFPSLSHLYNSAFANHLKMHVRERDDSVKEINFSFIVLVIHTTEYVIVQTIREMYFFNQFGKPEHTLPTMWLFSIRFKISLNNNRIWWNDGFAKSPSDLYVDFKRDFFLSHYKKKPKVIVVKQNGQKWARA